MQTIIHTPTNGLNSSLDFYRRLEFSVISDKNPTLVSDGQVVIEINPDRYARAGVKLYADGWKAVAAELAQLTSVIDIPNGYLLNDPSGVRIYLIEGQQPPAMDLPEVNRSILGNFAGISLESVAISRSVDIWQMLGFTVSGGKIDQGWISLVNQDQLNVSLMKPLMCPHLFFNPSLTYFNGKDNLSVIEKIRASGVAVTEEITHFNDKGIVDNVIIRDPGGYGFFVFND